MILLDPRIGSGELLPLFRPYGIHAVLEPLPAADIAFCGHGPDGSVFVGIERKKIGDLLSCMTSGRLAAGQLPEMQALYGVSYLFVEGIWRPDPSTGILQEYKGHEWRDVELGRRRMMAADMHGYITSLETFGGMRVRFTPGIDRTVMQACWLYNWWNKPWDKHGSFKLFQDLQTGVSSLGEPPLIRRMAKELPRIGWTRSKAVAEAFPNAIEMVNAPVSAWAGIAGIGKSTAGLVWRVLRGLGEKP